MKRYVSLFLPSEINAPLNLTLENILKNLYYNNGYQVLGFDNISEFNIFCVEGFKILQIPDFLLKTTADYKSIIPEVSTHPFQHLIIIFWHVYYSV